MTKAKPKRKDWGVVMATRVSAEVKRAAKRRATRAGTNLAGWLKGLVEKELGHAAA